MKQTDQYCAELHFGDSLTFHGLVTLNPLCTLGNLLSLSIMWTGEFEGKIFPTGRGVFLKSLRGRLQMLLEREGVVDIA